VTAVFMVIVIALGALVGLLQDGVFAQQISRSASHVMDQGVLGAVGDVLFF